MLESVITGAFTIIALFVAFFLKRFDARNTSQHAENKEVLDRIESKVDATAEAVTEHLLWHVSDVNPPKEAA